MKLNQSTEDFYLYLENYLQERNIKLTVIFKPNQYEYYNSKLEHKLYLGDGIDFPNYFSKQYWFDLGRHLNAKGAQIYTNKLSQEAKNL